MNRIFACVAAFGVAFVASPQAADASVLFSFASDTNTDGPTFWGHQAAASANNILEDAAPFDGSNSVNIGLMVDPNGDTPGGGTTFNSTFDFIGATTSYSVTGIGGGFLHAWTLSGAFNFTDTGTGLQVLQINFTNAVFTSFSNSSALLGPTATIQANEATDPVISFVPGSPLLGLGITAADLAAGEGFGFTLTNIRGAANPAAPLTLGQGGSWLTSWISEGSFSAAASQVPEPGALALLGCAAMLGMRARRRLA